jgi:U3 small nucleolar RNA-associated protein 10
LKPAFDTSVIRTDLVVDCVRTTESPQVQNTALLLVSSLAVIAPEQVLHSVMPIFTFMGSSILKKDDDYSVMVIDQTIHQVVPALVQSLRNQKRDVVAGTSELLLSFTAAFEHMPSHRRQRLFESLVTKLGAEDFLFAVLAMLSNRYGLDKNVSSLMTVLVSSVGPEVQLVVGATSISCVASSLLIFHKTFKKYLTLVGDSLQAKPGIAQVLLGLGNDGAEDKQRVAETLLRSLSYLLSHSSLRLKMATVHSGGSKDAINVIQALFSRILEQVLTMAETAEDVKHLHGAFGDVLASLLGTLSLVDLLNTLEELLKRPNADLQRKVLRLLEHRLRQSSERDGPSQNKVLDFIVVLVGIVQTSQDILLKHSAVACIDRIAEKYGRKNPIKVVDAAQVIASDACIGQNDNRIRIMGTLCLASMAEVLGQEIIPVLPEMLRRSLGLLEGSMADGVSNEELHNAVFSLLSALLVQVPFMLSDNNLDQILQLASKSAAADFSEESVEARRDTLKLIARKVIVKESFGAVERQWALAVLNGPAAVKEALEIVSIAIEKHAKSETVKNVGILSTLFRKAFDLRREQSSATDGTTFDDSELEKIESLVNDIVIKMIYKLNDSSFRPIFTEFVEWATNDLPKSDAHGRLQRLTSFYRFLQTFFGTLKSIVTSYASYIISNVVEVLHSAKPNSKDSKSLWLAAVRTLRSAFENDQDGKKHHYTSHRDLPFTNSFSSRVLAIPISSQRCFSAARFSAGASHECIDGSHHHLRDCANYRRTCRCN